MSSTEASVGAMVRWWRARRPREQREVALGAAGAPPPRSCLDGDCPSFVTVELPDPARAPRRERARPEPP
ncbi:hypothetical protein, partial [Nocardia wallacei]|uniref:hypothetical protein n=1 Tax=Nocardia wallacei TaxID=480035 RepID=UPI002457AA92